MNNTSKQQYKMRKIFLSIAICLIAICNSYAKDYKYTTIPSDMTQTRIYTLDNGLKVYLSVNKEKPRVTAHIAVNTGHRNDPADCTGLAHYLEHLMFKGSKQFGTTSYELEKPYIDQITALYEEYRQLTDDQARKAKYHEIDSVSQIAAQYNIPNEYDKLMALIGSEGSNAYTSFDVTCYTEDIPANEIERWAEIQSDRFQNLVMRGFHTELEAVYEEKNMSLTQDEEKAFDALLAKLFPSHSYGTQTTIGTQDHLKNPSLVEIQKYYDKYYKPNNIAICMAGDMDPEKVISTLDRYFGSWQSGNNTTPRQFPEQPAFTVPQDTTVVGLEKEQMLAAWRFDGVASQQSDTLSIISGILQNGSCGLIDLNINQKMAVQEADAGIFGLKDYSIFYLQASPKEGQTIEDTRDIMLAEIEKLKAGQFDDDLLTSYINNLKRGYMQQIESNRGRVSIMVDAFINGEKWESVVETFNRLEKITKADIVAFANKYFNNNYAIAYKRKGEDTNIKKIEKPEITPIPANREYASEFLANMSQKEVTPIQPVFVDYKKDLTFGETKKNLPVIYVQNKDNSLFTLQMRYDFGTQADNRYEIAASYLELLGTKKLSADDIKKQFYKLACDYAVDVDEENITIHLSGLQENMPQALALLEDVMQNSVADKEKYEQFVDMIIKERMDAKQNQKAAFNHLWQYAVNGKRNPYTDEMSIEQLKSTSPAEYTSLLKSLKNMEHTILYYGPASLEELCNVIDKSHKTSKTLAAVPANKPYEWIATPQSEVLIAPYEANNIYLRMINQKGKQWNVAEEPVIRLFNEYFGGGMNTIVFQELRETRGLAYNASALYCTPSRRSIPEFYMQHIISQNDKMMDCINVFKEITDTLPQNEAALTIAQQSLLKSIAARRVTKFNLINSYLAAKKLGIDYDINKNVYETLPKLTMKDIIDFEKNNIAGQPLRYVILGNEKELDMKSLEKVASIKRISLEEVFGY